LRTHLRDVHHLLGGTAINVEKSAGGSVFTAAEAYQEGTRANDCHFDDVHERGDRSARLERPPGESPDFGVLGGHGDGQVRVYLRVQPQV
jgi:hypothetical protein